MKIAVFHELPMGGARRVANFFSKELRKKNTVDLYVVDSGRKVDEESFFTKINFYKFVPKKWEGGDWRVKFYKDTIELWNLYKLHKKIAQRINNGKYDIVIVHPSKFTQAPFILRFTSSKSIYYAHESYRIIYESYFRYNYPENIMKNLYEDFSRYVKKVIDSINMKNATYIFVNSINTKKNIVKYYSRKGTVCYPGVDIDFFKPSSIRKDIDVLFVGSTNDNTDGFYDFKKALLQMPNITHRVIGNGKIWLTDRKFRSFYRRSRVVFCAAHNEPFGLVPLEAASCGVPVVAIKEGGYKETVIDGKTGYLVERENEFIQRAIKKLLENTSIRRNFSKNARLNVVKNWSINKSSKRLEDELLKIISRG